MLTPIHGDACRISQPAPVLLTAGAPPLALQADDWSPRFLVLDLVHRGAHAGKLHLACYAHGEAEPRLTVLLGLIPGLPARLSLDLSFRDGQTLFLRRHPGLLKGVVFGRRLPPDEMERIELSLEDTGDDQAVMLGLPHLSERDQPDCAPTGPVVDELGQWAQRTWPGKIRDATELVHSLHTALNGQPTQPVSGRSSFGGSLAHRFHSSGFFRTEHDGTRWWLVDPSGHGFWSAGIDCVRPTQDTSLPVGTAALCAWLPADAPEFADAWQSGATPRADFVVANLIRAFGTDWHGAWRRLVADQFRAWGVNTIGNWSEPELGPLAGIPYVVPMPSYPRTEISLFRDLPDVFDPAFATAAADWAEHLRPLAHDPLLVGYFLTNEPHWGFGDFNLASEMLEHRPGSHSRTRLASWLAERHHGSIERLSTAWGVSFSSFTDFEQGCFHRLADRSPAAAAELWEFSRLLVRAYITIPSAACRKVAPHHLNLGLRYAWIASDLCYEAAACVDVFTLNCYQMLPASEQAAEIQRRCGRPTLIGEWHMGALDRGLPSTGLRAVTDQRQRGVAYRRFLEAAAADPNVIGAHWFQYADQALLGRSDGENYQIGCVDVGLRPYPELASAMRASHELLYQVVSGECPPYALDACAAKTVAF